MSRVYRSTPVDTVEELFAIYGALNTSGIPFFEKLSDARLALEDVLVHPDYHKYGVVMSVEGTWGSGKTSFVKLMREGLKEKNVAVIHYDSLFYGNVSEATSIFLDNIFTQVKERFGVELKNGLSIAKNISPRFELSNGIPKFSLDYTPRRAPTELIQEELNTKLVGLSGKVIVIIDDLDRVSAEDAIHFLRIVRVLRELPNFIVILPIDRRALENLLRKDIENPRKYLYKIIDYSVDINPEINSAKSLFSHLIKSASNQISDSLVDYIWKILLWEIALILIDSEEVRSLGMNLGAPASDPNWQRVNNKLRAVDSDTNLIKAFLNRTSADYGADFNLVTRIVNHSDPRRDSYRHYIQLLNGQNFSDFFTGQAVPTLSQTESLENGQPIDMMRTRWWRDSPSLIENEYNQNRGNRDAMYELRLPNDADQIGQHYTRMNAESIRLWDEIQDLATQYFPYESLEHLAPRTLNNIVARMNMKDFEAHASQDTITYDDLASLQLSIRVAVRGAILSNR